MAHPALPETAAAHRADGDVWAELDAITAQITAELAADDARRAAVCAGCELAWCATRRGRPS